MKRTKPLKVGFDLDGVLLYNPTRVIRPLVSVVKRALLHKRKLKFYYPKTSVEKVFWALAHKSSIYTAPGLEEITRLVEEGKIEAYLITARFAFLGPGVQRWVKKKHLEKTFTGVYYNAANEQPHEFKERMIKKLKLDLYVEDNFDIVQYLKEKTSARVLWIYNIFDSTTPFPHKFPHLKDAIQFITTL
jgi:hypothetical protein